MFDFVTMRYMNPIYEFLSADEKNQLSLEQLGDLGTA